MIQRVYTTFLSNIQSVSLKYYIICISLTNFRNENLVALHRSDLIILIIINQRCDDINSIDMLFNIDVFLVGLFNFLIKIDEFQFSLLVGPNSTFGRVLFEKMLKLSFDFW